MPFPVPRVLQRLHALGLTQTALAAHLGVTQAAVSLWLTGKRPFDEPWRTDADALLAIVREHLAQGQPLATVAFRPTHFMNRGGTTRTGEGAPLTEEAYADLRQCQQDLAAQGPDRFVAGMRAWAARHTTSYLADALAIDPRTWDPSAEELDTLRRMALGLVLDFNHLLQIKAHKAVEGEPDADQTP